MRNKVVLVSLVLSLAALIFFLYNEKDAAPFIEAPANSVGQEQQSPNGPPARTEASAQTQERTTGQRDFFLGGVSFSDIKSRAESGDAVAQRYLSEIYEDCMFYSLNPEKHLTGLDQLSDMKPESKPYLRKIKAQMSAFCSTVDNGQAISAKAYVLWRDRSAQAGDLTSKIRGSSQADKPPSPAELQTLFEKVSQTGDPNAMFEFGSLAASNQEWSGQKGNEALYGQYAEYAWQIAACRRGLNCSGESRLMRNICTGTFACQYRNYQDFLYAEMIPQGSRKDIENRILLINKNFIQAGQN